MHRAVIIAVILGWSSALAANWPEWRGPARNGTTEELNLPLKWSASDNVRWKVALPGPGNSTPIVWEDKVFVTQAIEPEGKRLLLCLSRRDGSTIWEKGTLFAEKEPTHETNPQCSASPATDGERVVAWFGSAGLFCYDLDGKELWKRDLGRQRHEWGYAASPVIHKDWVYLNFGPGENSFMVALDKKTGAEVWRFDVEERHYKERRDGFNGRGTGVVGSWSTPLVVQAGGRDEVVLSVPDRIVGLDAKTGREIWRCAGMNPLVYTSPVASGGFVTASGGFGGPDLVVRLGGEGDVTPTRKVWESSGRTGNRLGSAVIKDGYLFLATMPGLAECFELSTGKPVWSERIRGVDADVDIWSSPVLSGDRIYVVNQSGETLVFKASPKFELLAANSIGNEMCNASPAIANGEIFLRTHENLWCIAATTKTAAR